MTRPIIVSLAERTRLACAALSALFTVATCAVPGGAFAQAAAPTPPKTAAKPGAAAASKPAAKSSAKSSTKGRKPAPEPVVEAAPEPADEAQIDAATRVFTGVYDCEFKVVITITPDEKYPHYIDVKHGKTDYLMKPVLSSTGAIRLEDVRGEALMVQISAKSMLLNLRTGHRIADECVSPRQREIMEAKRAARAAEAAASAASAAEAADAVKAAAAAPTAAAATASGAPATATASPASSALPASSATPTLSPLQTQ